MRPFKVNLMKYGGWQRSLLQGEQVSDRHQERPGSHQTTTNMKALTAKLSAINTMHKLCEQRIHQTNNFILNNRSIWCSLETISPRFLYFLVVLSIWANSAIVPMVHMENEKWTCFTMENMNTEDCMQVISSPENHPPMES